MKYSNVGWATFCAAVAAVTLITLGIPAAVQAQSQGLSVNIPFEFYVGDQLLSPGTYAVWKTGTGGAVTISDRNGHSVVTLTNAVRRPSARTADNSLLVFKVYGDRRFLNEVRWAGYMDARGLPQTKLELEIAKNIQATNTNVAAK
jgi:hypothetical protein